MEERLSRRSFLKMGAVAGAVAASAGVMASCTPGANASGDASSSGDASGTFAATVPSMKGDIAVYVTLDGESITKVDVVDEVDSPIIRDAAIESITKRIVEQQNIEVDVVSGATMTSMAILNGAKEALGQAGNAKAFQKGSDVVADKKAGSAETYDIVVVGSGMAGLSAAVTASKNPDLKVLVLEKQAIIGGSTRVCGGGLWAMGSPENVVIGQDCSLEDYIGFMQTWSEPTVLNTDLMANIRSVSGETFDYAFGYGLPVNTSAWSLGNPDAQLPVFWATTGLDAPWETGDSGIADFMATLAKKNGVEIRINSKVTKINVEGGSAAGVEVEDLESIYTVNAKKVILASGGFTRNPDLIKKYAPDYIEAIPFTGGGSTGDGLVMGEELGATVVGAGMMGLTGINSNLGYYGEFGNAVWMAQMTVNAEGEEFGMNGAFYGKTLKLLLDQTGSCGYGIYDATNSYVEHLERGVEAGYFTKYDTLDELASGEGIAADPLKAAAEKNKISKAPFYCVIRRPLFIGSIPGLKVSSKCEILDSSDKPIENLYAAGEVMFGNVFSNAYPCSGTGVGTSCYTGAVATNAAIESMA